MSDKDTETDYQEYAQEGIAPEAPFGGTKCILEGCTNIAQGVSPLCPTCHEATLRFLLPETSNKSMSQRYPKYYKDVTDLKEVDVYMVHQLFGLEDPSGALQHASKKILLPGVRTGGKSRYDDIREARDTLTRWLEIQDMYLESAPSDNTVH